MAKLIFFAAFLAALVAVSVAQREAEAMRFRDMQCRREVQESPLDACRRVVDQQLAGRLRSFPFLTSAGVRMQCCQQLQDVSRECRCAAIRRMVRDYEQELMPLEEGYYGETAQQQQEPGFYGEAAERQQQGEGYYGEAAERQQQGERYYGETAGQQQGQEYYSQTAEWAPQQQTTRVRLTKARQSSARLPTMCRMEPQSCSVFAAGQY